jgi:hypothetical protein
MFPACWISVTDKNKKVTRLNAEKNTQSDKDHNKAES